MFWSSKIGEVESMHFASCSSKNELEEQEQQKFVEVK
jgi:hypothetical protein